MYKILNKREYEKDGETKTYWATVGRGFDAKNGIVIRLDAVPTNWDGSLYLVEDKPKEDTQAKGSWEQQGQKFAAKKADVAPVEVQDEPIDMSEIPFN